MKKSLIFLMVLTLSLGSVLKAESNKHEARLTKSMKNEKTIFFDLQDKQDNMKKWRTIKDKIILQYKKFLERNDNISNEDCEYSTDSERRQRIIKSYNYDKTDPKINQVIEFLIFAVENEKTERLKIEAIKKLTIIALNQNEKAKSYIKDQNDNLSLSHRLTLEFKLSYLTLEDSQTTFDYFMNLIKKAQDIETTDVKYNSSDERIIAWYLISKYPSLRHSFGLDYNYGLPLLKQLIFSRDKIVGSRACSTYYDLTNRTEIKRIYKECWAKVNDKNTPRKEFINALYGLQSLYALQQSFEGIGGEHRIGFKGILGYFMDFAVLKYIPKINTKKYILVANEKEKRLSSKEKIYFSQRLKRQ